MVVKEDPSTAPPQSSVGETQSGDRLDLVLASKRRKPTEGRYTWLPFEHDDRFRRDWWEAPYLCGNENVCVQVWQGSVEVARVLLDEVVGISHYAGAPLLDGIALKIQFFEVAAGHRGEGIGSAVVRLLEDAHQGRRLVAFSEGADGFWSSLGWDRYEHGEEPGRFQALFVQPGAG